MSNHTVGTKAGSEVENDKIRILNVSVGGYSSKGVKAENQDAFAVNNLARGNTLKYKGIAACIADGVSCSINAQNASQISVTQFIQDYYCSADSWSVKESAARVLTALNGWLYHHSKQDGQHQKDGWVSTFSSIIFKSTTAHIFHIGDSRIYCFRAGQLQQLSRDHCHKTGDGKTFLSRALGMDSHLEVDYLQQPLQVGDVYMLSTDGIHDYLTPADISRALSQQGADLETTAKSLSHRAMANNSTDNLTCLLLKVEALPASNIDEINHQLSDLVIPPALEVGNKIDNFIISKVIYSSRRSHLYQVEEQHSRQRFILKTPSLNFSGDQNFLEGFVREQWVGQRLNHPGVMKIYPRPSNSPFLYHLCELIEGQTLRQWMRDNPKPALEQVRDITFSIVRAIRAFRRMGMVHRDLKPENIMIKPGGQAVVIDFGTVQIDSLNEMVSRAIEPVPVGSAGYLAPEYWQGQLGQHRSDIFSLGVIVYEMLTAELPYQESLMETNNPQNAKHWSYQSLTQKRKDLPVWLDLTLKKACQTIPAKRYQALSEFEVDLSKANKAMMQAFDKAPYIEREPIKFWQYVSALLLLTVIIQAIYLPP